MMFISMAAAPLVSLIRFPESPFNNNIPNSIKIKKFKREKKDNYTFTVFDVSEQKTLKLTARELAYGIVTAEMPAWFEFEALKAQTIAALTYCTYEKEKNRKINPDSEYDFKINTSETLWYAPFEKKRESWGKDFKTYRKKIKKAVKEINGEIIKDSQGRAICAMFHSMSCGKTYNYEEVFVKKEGHLGKMNYLQSVESPGDLLAPKYLFTVTFSKEEFAKLVEEKLNVHPQGENPETWVNEIQRYDSGLVKCVNISGKEFPGSVIRSALGLRSSNFDISWNQNKFQVITRGYGHGVGMSQYGANYMAANGSSCNEILAHYYPNTTIVS
jgi:stage II sporulation protein D